MKGPVLSQERLNWSPDAREKHTGVQKSQKYKSCLWEGILDRSQTSGKCLSATPDKYNSVLISDLLSNYVTRTGIFNLVHGVCTNRLVISTL